MTEISAHCLLEISLLSWHRKISFLLSVLPVGPAGFVGSIWVMDSGSLLPGYHSLRAQTSQVWGRFLQVRDPFSSRSWGFSLVFWCVLSWEHPCLDGWEMLNLIHLIPLGREGLAEALGARAPFPSLQLTHSKASFSPRASAAFLKNGVIAALTPLQNILESLGWSFCTYRLRVIKNQSK